VFGTIFTMRLTENLTGVFTGAGASAGDAARSTASLDPQTLAQLPPAVRDGVVTAYADALAPVFWSLLPFIGLAFLVSLLLKQNPLADVAGLVARGEAVGARRPRRWRRSSGAAGRHPRRRSRRARRPRPPPGRAGATRGGEAPPRAAGASPRGPGPAGRPP